MKKILFLVVALAISGLLASQAFAAVVALVSIDTHEAPSDGFAGPYFTPTLDAGQPYLMTISGTYSFWQPSRWGSVCAGTPEASPQIPSPATTNGPVGVDPEYAFAVPSGSSACSSPTPLHLPNLQISLDGGSTFTHLEPIVSDFNASHSYQYLVLGLGVPAAIGFQLLDGSTTDNYGVLTATVEATDAGAFATGGGTVDLGGGDANFGFVGTAPFSGAVDNAAVYDPATNSWTVLTPISIARGGAAAQAVGGKIYVVGGLDANGVSLAGIEVYDPATDSWSFAAPMSTPRDNPGSAVLGGKLYIFGGRDRGVNETLSTVEMYDTATDTWTARAPMPTGRRRMVVGTLNGRAQVMGGEEATNGSTFPQNEEYNPITNAWRTLTPMSTPRHGAAAGTINGVVYVAGGGPTGGSSFIDIVEAFAFQDP